MDIQNLVNIIKEGQEKSLVQMDLLEKQLNGTITPEETQRLVMLNGNLLALARQAQAYGYGTEVMLPTISVAEAEDSTLDSEYISENSAERRNGERNDGDIFRNLW